MAGKIPCDVCGEPTSYHSNRGPDRPTHPRCRPARHGTPTQYGKGCRCKPCRQAEAERHRQLVASGRLKRAPCAICGEPSGYAPSRAPASPTHPACRPVPHGTEAGYARGCRCRDCQRGKAEAMRVYAVEYKRRTGRSLSDKYRKPSGEYVRSGNGIPRKVRLEVSERDSWICHSSFTPVDQSLDFNDRMAATLDHIECQSHALIPDHSAKNLRLAHRACNSSRRDRFAEQEVR